MAKRIILADNDALYIRSLQSFFVDEIFVKNKVAPDDCDIEVITDKSYYDELFARPQRADVLVVSEGLYSPDLQKHDITNIFLLVDGSSEWPDELNVEKLPKYSNAKEIVMRVLGKGNPIRPTHPGCKLVLVYSAAGGVGKTTVAMGIAANLAKNYKNVLYINASGLQSFHRAMENKSVIGDLNVYTKLKGMSSGIYEGAKAAFRQETFTYLPPFKTGLIALGLDYSIYEKIAVAAKESEDFDVVIVDADSEFNEKKTALINIADRVVLVTKQNETSVFAMNQLISNISTTEHGKYFFVCNDLREQEENALKSGALIPKFKVCANIEHVDHLETMKIAEYANISGIRELSILVV